MVIGAGLMGGSYVFAQGTADQPTLVSMIAGKFNLKTSDVQAVFDEYHSQRQTQREADYEQYLSELVSNGKITSAKKMLLLDKHNQIIADRKAEWQKLKGMTLQERVAQRQTERKNLQSWARQNNIPLQYLFGGFGMGRYRMGV